MIRRTEVPAGTLLHALRRERGGHADCFVTECPGTVTLFDYVTAFYTSPLFRAERAVLRAGGHRSSDTDIPLIMTGQADRFAVWRVRRRTDTELLMRQIGGPTASWFMVAPSGPTTRLYFGSAVLPDEDGGLGSGVRLLMPLHLIYSRALLAAAKRGLARARR